MGPLDGAVTAFIGCGAMGEAMVAGMLRRGLVEPGQMIASHPRPARRAELATRYGIRVEESNRAAVEAASLIALTVKPQILPLVEREMRGALRPEQTVLSICAGVSLSSLTSGLDHAAVARAMPNMPTQIGQGVTVWTATEAVAAGPRDQVRAILAALGTEVWVDDEHQIAAATALSGSGPAYIFLVMEALIDVGVQLGFSRRMARDLVLRTMHGSVMVAEQSGLHPAELRNAVTSPGGTTAAALFTLEKGGLRTVLAEGVLAAYHRTLELSQATGPARADGAGGAR